MKFQDNTRDDILWAGASETTRSPPSSPTRQQGSSRLGGSDSDSKSLTEASSGADEVDGGSMRAYWQSLRDKYSSNHLLDHHDISALPPNWVAISINVTEDRTTMFVSRHQADHDPLVFTLPLDRQGKREGEAEEDLFTFDAAVSQLTEIIRESDETSRNTKGITTNEAKAEWWNKRFDLDRRLKELVTTMEFCWLGAFKVSDSILVPVPDLTADHPESTHGDARCDPRGVPDKARADLQRGVERWF